MKNALLHKGAGAATNKLNDSTFAQNYISIDQQFRQAMLSAGIHYSGEIVADAKTHRFHIEGHKRSSLNGAYRLYADSCPGGWFKDYKSRIYQTWRSGSNSRISYAFTKQIQEAKRQREAEIRQKHETASKKAKYIWSQSKTILNQSDHPYLISKRIQPHGAMLYGDSLVIPLKDEIKRIVSLEFISPEGGKLFLSGGRKSGCYYPIGQPTPRILIAEGFATAASLHEETDQCVIVAFDAGNLLSVAKVIRAMFPSNEIIIAGDNDLSGAGQLKAREAALSVGAKVLIPPVPGTDWNDVIAGDSHD